MVPNVPNNQPNPLKSFMRQPKIYIRLPSGGEFWPAGSLIISETGEYPVFSMTAKDELMLKVPDAVMNGQAVVEVIQHCIPNIKNAWKTPNLDMDLILIAIRIATYGEKMNVPIKLGEFESDYSLDLRIVNDTLLEQINWDPAVQINDDLTIYVKPINYKVMTDSALQTFETQKIIQLVNDQNLSDEQKRKAFQESFDRLNQLTLGIITNSVFKIESSQGSTSDPKHIREFMENADKEIFDKVRNHIDTLRVQNAIKPIKIKTTDEMREAGVIEEFVEIPLQFDPANFFV
jgi:hypothetical protein